MKSQITTLVAIAATTFALSAGAADTAKTTDGQGITKDEAKSLKAHSDGNFKAKKNVAEANEDLNRADCKASLDGSAKRACESSAKHAAKSDKAAAKATHEQEQKAIDNAKK